MKIELRDRRPGVQWLCSLAPEHIDGGLFGYRIAAPAIVTGASVNQNLLVGGAHARTPSHVIAVTDWPALKEVACRGACTLFGLHDLTIIAVCHLSAATAEGLTPFVAGLVAAGAAVWVEVDDDVFTGEWAPKYLERFLGREARAERDKLVAVERRQVAAMRRLAGVASGVIASTPALAQVARRYNPHVAGLPNMLHAGGLSPHQRPAGPVTLGYAGVGLGHLLDLRALAQRGLLECARKPGTDLHFWSVNPRGREPSPAGRNTFDGVPYTLHLPELHFPTYLRQIGILDVAVAPLLDHAVNRARSAGKWLEHSFHGTAMVVSDLAPYACVTHGVTGFKAKSAEEFTHYLHLLVDDADLRQRIGAAAQAEVMRAHTTEALGPLWRAFVEDAASTCAGGPYAAPDGDAMQSAAWRAYQEGELLIQ